MHGSNHLAATFAPCAPPSTGPQALKCLVLCAQLPKESEKWYAALSPSCHPYAEWMQKCAQACLLLLALRDSERLDLHDRSCTG